MTPNEKALEDQLIYTLKLPAQVADYLLSIYKIIQFFDDVADNETHKITRADFDEVLYQTLVGVYRNKFFSDYAQELLPILSNMIFKWQASDRLERRGKVDEVTFVWRSGYFDLVMHAVTIIHGPERAAEYSEFVLNLYGEKYADYAKEFNYA